MATAPATLMTVEDFLKIPEPVGDYSYELHQGALVRVTRPRLKHTMLQERLRNLLRAAAPEGSFVTVEFPFRPLPEHELRVADVGYAAKERWASVDPEDVFQGAPDLVIEVLSPSNTAAEIFDKEQICLENGCREFWVVDDKHKFVRIMTAEARVAFYRTGQSIPLDLLGGGTLPVDSIFA